jgi:hypothetical protein
LVDKECIADYNSPESMAAKLKQSREYMGTPALNLVYSNQHIDLQKFGKDTIITETNIIFRQFDTNNPNWLSVEI